MKTRFKIRMRINSRNDIGDNFCSWRADYVEGGDLTTDGNLSCDTALVENDDDVTINELEKEYRLQDIVQWNDDRIVTFFFQADVPYDVTQTYDDSNVGSNVMKFKSCQTCNKGCLGFVLWHRRQDMYSKSCCHFDSVLICVFSALCCVISLTTRRVSVWDKCHRNCWSSVETWRFSQSLIRLETHVFLSDVILLTWIVGGVGIVDNTSLPNWRVTSCRTPSRDRGSWLLRIVDWQDNACGQSLYSRRVNEVILGRARSRTPRRLEALPVFVSRRDVMSLSRQLFCLRLSFMYVVDTSEHVRPFLDAVPSSSLSSCDTCRSKCRLLATASFSSPRLPWPPELSKRQRFNLLFPKSNDVFVFVRTDKNS